MCWNCSARRCCGLDREYGAKAQAAQGKIEAILPETVRKETFRARNAVKLVTGREADNSEEGKQYIEILRQAVLEERKVKFGYKKQILEADGNRNSVRTASPYGMALFHGMWMLIAYCHLRQELRHFRLSRISELSLLEDRFESSRRAAGNLAGPPAGRIAAVGAWLGIEHGCFRAAIAAANGL